MERWRLCLALAVLLLLPKISAKNEEEDDDDRRSDDAEEDDDDDDDDEEEEGSEKGQGAGARRSGGGHGSAMGVRRAPGMAPTGRPPAGPPNPGNVVKVAKKRPLECYVCAFKAETPLRACLDPIKFRVHTITCHSTEDKCFTSVISKGENYEAVVRGCRSGCIGSTETTCCEHNRCNNQAFLAPLLRAQQAQQAAAQGFPPQGMGPGGMVPRGMAPGGMGPGGMYQGGMGPGGMVQGGGGLGGQIPKKLGENMGQPDFRAPNPYGQTQYDMSYLYQGNSGKTCLPPTVLFFVSILLLLQTVVKVAFV